MEAFNRQDKSLGELLIQAGFINNEQLKEALEEQGTSGEPLGKILIAKHYVKEEHIITVLKGMLVVVVELNKEKFGIEIVYSREIIKYKKITALPNMPPHILGMMNIREEVIPVISLNRRIFGREDVITEDTRIIIVDGRTEPAGIMVDNVVTVKNYQASDFANITRYSFTIDKKYIAGLIRDGESVITLIKPEILLEAK
jgi:purine-binding chemotaxis protein CheW